MSLTSSQTADAAAKCSVILRTADQYSVWKCRVADSCWAATHRDIFSITDGDCKTGMEAYENALDARAKAKKAEAVVGPDDWVGKCWLIITTSLDNEVYRKVSHVRKGAIQCQVMSR